MNKRPGNYSIFEPQRGLLFKRGAYSSGVLIRAGRLLIFLELKAIHAKTKK